MRHGETFAGTFRESRRGLDELPGRRHSQGIADERELIEFDTEYVLSEVFPERIDAPDSWRRCSLCGAASKAWPASELTVVKRHHGNQPLGHLVLYCHDHITRANEWDSIPGGSRELGPVCPKCHLSVPVGTLECEGCGWIPPD